MFTYISPPHPWFPAAAPHTTIIGATENIQLYRISYYNFVASLPRASPCDIAAARCGGRALHGVPGCTGQAHCSDGRALRPYRVVDDAVGGSAPVAYDLPETYAGACAGRVGGGTLLLSFVEPGWSVRRTEPHF